ncbi:MAG: leucyl aminopeptidase, partial [Solirubrobacteraceae bacterium]|nr:leucyl aminopeptidase [Solirubrobacteraceae bacterium]
MPSVTVAAVEPTETAADTVAVGFFENEDIGHGLGQLTEAKAGLGKVAVTHAGGKRWLAVGLGRRSEFAIEPARIAAGAAWSRAQDLGAQTLAWALPGGVSAGGIVEGSVLAAHPVARYKSEPAEDTLTALVVCGADAAEADEARVLAEAVNAGRDLQNAPANVMTPTALATHARKLAAELGMTVDVLGREQLRAAGMGAFSAVAQGARQEPQLITLRYSPANAGGPTLALVGKAVTFDTGGISIKPGMKMSDMKFDMSGGAAVLAAMEAIARLALPVSVIGVVGATDNDVGSAAVKPGDIVRARSGTTIEILNTDAEGRLV